MFYSLTLQMNYIRFKRKSIVVPATIESIITNKIGHTLKVKFNYEEKEILAKAFCINYPVKENDQIDIAINPKISALYQEKEQTVHVQNYSPMLYHMVIIIFAMIILSLV